MEDIKQKFNRYAENKIRIAELEAENDTLNPEITEWLVANNPDPDKDPVGRNSYGEFVVYYVDKYTYTSAVEEAKKAVKDIEANERRTGAAKATKESRLRFNPKKDDN